MPKILVIASAKTKPRAGFRTHGELFRAAYGVSQPVSYGMGEDNCVGA